MRKWTFQETQYLRRACAEGLTLTWIGQKLNRSAKSLYNHARRLSIPLPPGATSESKRFWNAARDGTLAAQWLLGVRTADIAVAIGCSGNAVIGRARRLKLPPHPVRWRSRKSDKESQQ
jgi:hypothetical protein